MTTPWIRAGITEAEYRRWASGADVPDDVEAAILQAAEGEPARRILLAQDGKSSMGVEEIFPDGTRVFSPNKPEIVEGGEPK